MVRAAVHDAIDVIAHSAGACVAMKSGKIGCFLTSGPDDEDAAVLETDTYAGYRAAMWGNYAGCGVRDSGEIACFGQHYGPIGRHEMSSAVATPVEVAKLADATAVAIAGDRSCAVRRTGAVACWKADGAVKEVAGLTGVKALNAGAEFVCAQGRGTTSCWGRPAWRECVAMRSRHHDPCQQAIETPARAAGWLDDKDAVEAVDPCVRRKDGSVACRLARQGGLAIRVGRDAVSVSSECAALKDGTVSCWDSAGTVTAVDGVHDAVAVVSGQRHSCALRRGGAVTCWGANELGQLGKDLPADVAQLAATGDTTCARRTSGAVSCWGSNAHGALGDGTGKDSATPVAVSVSDATQLAGNALGFCARRATGAVACWGLTPKLTSDYGFTPVEKALPVVAPE